MIRKILKAVLKAVLILATLLLWGIIGVAFLAMPY